MLAWAEAAGCATALACSPLPARCTVSLPLPPSMKSATDALAATPRQSRDKEKPLLEDIRLLGRILGDVIRAQEGAQAYELVEQIRKDEEEARALLSGVQPLGELDAKIAF